MLWVYCSLCLLGDMLNKAKLIPFLMFGASAGLFICATSTNLSMLWLGTIITGLFSVAAQVLIPLATMAVKPEKTGEVVGFLMSGLLVGILTVDQCGGITLRLMALENDLCAEWHCHVCFGPSDERKTTTTTKTQNHLFRHF